MDVPLPVRVFKEQNGVISEFNEDLWNGLVEKLVVKTRDDVTVVFKDGTETKAEQQRNTECAHPGQAALVLFNAQKAL